MKKLFFLLLLHFTFCILHSFAQNVGIGTTAPQTKLHIGNYDTDSLAVLTLSTSSTNVAPIGNRYSSIYFRHFDNTYGSTIEEIAGPTIAGLNFKSHTNDSAGISNLFIDRISGNVGVRNTNPKARLDVNGNVLVNGTIQLSTAAIPMGLVSEVGGITPLLNMSINFREPNKTNNVRGMAFRLDSRDYAAPFQWLFRARNSVSDNTLMVLDSSGKLGIGTSSPGKTLDVNGVIRTNSHLVFNAAGGVIDWGSAGHLYFRTNAVAGDETGYTDRMVLTQDGNLGVGTSSPAYKFVVTTSAPGTFAARIDNTANDPTFSSNGLRITAGQTNFSKESAFVSFYRPDGTAIGHIIQASSTSVSYNTTSDERLKSNIADTRFGIADLDKIQVKDYNYNDEKSSNRQTGFLAQQLYTIFPNAVAKGGEDAKTNPWMVDYSRVTPLLVKSVQDLSAQNTELKKQVQSLEAKVNALMQQFANMKQTPGVPGKN